MKTLVDVKINGKLGKYAAKVDAKEAFKALQVGYNGTKVGAICEMPVSSFDVVDKLYGNGLGRNVSIAAHFSYQGVFLTSGVHITHC